MLTPLPQRKEATLRGTLAVGALALVLAAVVLASCGGGASSSGGRGGGSSSTSSRAATGGYSGGAGKHGSASPTATTTKKGASNSAAKGASGGVLKTIVIKETEFKLSPSTVTLSKPGTYAFKAENKGSTQHSLEIDGEGIKSKGGGVGEAKLEPYLDPGQSGVLTLTFQKPGTYEMYCPVIGHRLAGMKGSVVVK
jgi:uncharacterized cupredoxin-like copper-binding protein